MAQGVKLATTGPIEKCYGILAGASAHPGGAVHGALGAKAAQAALARNGWTGPAYRAAIQAVHRVLYRQRGVIGA